MALSSFHSLHHPRRLGQPTCRCQRGRAWVSDSGGGHPRSSPASGWPGVCPVIQVRGSEEGKEWVLPKPEPCPLPPRQAVTLLAGDLGQARHPPWTPVAPAHEVTGSFRGRSEDTARVKEPVNSEGESLRPGEGRAWQEGRGGEPRAQEPERHRRSAGRHAGHAAARAHLPTVTFPLLMGMRDT